MCPVPLDSTLHDVNRVTPLSAFVLFLPRGIWGTFLGGVFRAAGSRMSGPG
jgi:hypothetical protein